MKLLNPGFVFLRLYFILPDVSGGGEFCKKLLLNPFTLDLWDAHCRFSGKFLLTYHLGVRPFS
jgi:hypothetical protein